MQLGTTRVRAKDQQRLFNHELSRRLKNTLKMVQAVVAQTLRNVAEPKTARNVLNDRLATLGRAHDILMSGEGESADMRVVVEGALHIHHDALSSRFAFAGPRVACGVRSALSLALVVHELATYAAKYGP